MPIRVVRDDRIEDVVDRSIEIEREEARIQKKINKLLYKKNLLRLEDRAEVLRILDSPRREVENVEQVRDQSFRNDDNDETQSEISVESRETLLGDEDVAETTETEPTENTFTQINPFTQRAAPEVEVEVRRPLTTLEQLRMGKLTQSPNTATPAGFAASQGFLSLRGLTGGELE